MKILAYLFALTIVHQLAFASPDEIGVLKTLAPTNPNRHEIASPSAVSAASVHNVKILLRGEKCKIGDTCILVKQSAIDHIKAHFPNMEINSFDELKKLARKTNSTGILAFKIDAEEVIEKLRDPETIFKSVSSADKRRMNFEAEIQYIKGNKLVNGTYAFRLVVANNTKRSLEKKLTLLNLISVFPLCGPRMINIPKLEEIDKLPSEHSTAGALTLPHRLSYLPCSRSPNGPVKKN